MQKEWRYRDYKGDEKSLIKRLLYSRGFKSEEEIYEFLHPLEMKLSKPDVFCDMQKTVERINQAIQNNEKIIVYGDFDVDGITSTSILYKTLKYLGADVNYFVPNRDKEGHGLNDKAIITLLTTVKPKIIISVDCGISDFKIVNHLKTYHVDVIITDHHEAPDILPEAFSIINPKAQNSLDENLSIKEIESLTSFAGCGVAFKLAQALLQYYKKSDFVYEILPFVAVGTIADVVPLIGENRYFVVKGLNLIKNHYGLTRLFESCGYKIENGITAENIGFGIAPRINASGRLDTVDDALKVFLSDNKQEIEIAIKNLNELNSVRQELCQKTFLEADEMVKKEGNKNSAIVLYNKDWLGGIIGIVASKLVEKYYKPVFLMTYNQEKKEICCSARSIEGISIYDVININSDIITGGGHKFAGGFSFSTENTDFESVKKAINETVKEMLGGKVLEPFIDIDLEITSQDINIDLVNEISQLEPFGAGNPNPVFAIKNLTVKQKTLMGSVKEHLKITAGDKNCDVNCIRWSMGDVELQKDDVFDVAFYPRLNDYNGNISVQLIVEDIHSEKLQDKKTEEFGIKLYDHRNKTDILPLVNDYVKTSKQKIGIFAESKSVKDLLTPYKYLLENIFNRQNIEPCDCLMFFDYPADKETFNKIIEECNPSSIHFMKYNIKHFDKNEFLTTFVKMLRYAYNNNCGKVDLLRFTSALGKSFEVILSLLELFEKVNFIKILEKNSNYYKIELLEIKDFSALNNNKDFEEIISMLNDCEVFQKSLLEKDLLSLELL